ncbi:MAG: shikimate dehydrogenase [Alistipes sp.]|nr:shikimate dehydrogenase [Alistipes sp.]MDE6858008.1 shikimate dehydrogenase [Alistipes sp.]
MREFGLIGRTLGHSASQRYFTAKFERESVADCTYSLFELPNIDDVRTLLAGHPDLCGFNVTIPYKREIIPYLSDMSFDARNIGAVNCVRREGERLIGYNTDVDGVRRSFDELLGSESPKALVLGTGGASQAVQYVLAERGMEYALVSRDGVRGNMTYGEVSAEVMDEYRLIINATPVGTYPAVDEAPMLPYAFLTPSHYLFDLVYNPPVTQFLDYGRQRGAHILNGETMFRAQAESAWRIWNGAF